MDVICMSKLKLLSQYIFHYVVIISNHSKKYLTFVNHTFNGDCSTDTDPIFN